MPVAHYSNPRLESQDVSYSAPEPAIFNILIKLVLEGRTQTLNAWRGKSELYSEAVWHKSIIKYDRCSVTLSRAREIQTLVSIKWNPRTTFLKGWSSIPINCFTLPDTETAGKYRNQTGLRRLDKQPRCELGIEEKNNLRGPGRQRS